MKKYVFKIMAEKEEGNSEQSIDLLVLASTRAKAVQETKRVTGKEYTYFRVYSARDFKLGGGEYGEV